MFVKLAISLLLLFLSFHASAAPRTVFVQLFEWPWQDVARECETYLGPSGFSAVQVSPPHEHIVWEHHPWWERYQVVSYNLNSRSGDEAAFKDMVQRCHKVGVDIYVDAVINHATGVPGGQGFGGTPFSHYDYPGLYSYNDFHHCGRNGNDNIMNYNDRYELQHCELVDLADLKTGSEYVRNKIASYLNHLLDLGVAGFRIDAAKHIPAQDLMAIKSKLKRSAYIYSEVIYDPSGPVEYSEYLPVGDVMAYDYARSVARGFLDKNVELLRYVEWGFPASSDSIVFLTNHDLERWNSGVLSYNGSNQDLYRLAQIFLLSWPFGYPHLYSGYAFTDTEVGPPLSPDLSTSSILDNKNHCRAPWTCEHRAPEIPAMVDFRNQTDKAFGVSAWWSNGRDILAFSRGPFGFIAINASKNTFSNEFTTSMADGVYCNIIDPAYDVKTHTCPQGFEVKSGKVQATLQPMSALVLLKKTLSTNMKK